MKVLITGDFCPIGRIEKYNDFKLKKSINEFSKIAEDSDIFITNLECPLIDGESLEDKFGPSLKASIKTISILNDLGVNVVTLANNHIMDHGKEGLISSIHHCKESNIDIVGAGSNINEARKPLIKNIDNKSIAFFNVAENEFSNTNGDEYGSNPLDLVKNFEDINTLKNTVDYIVVIYHGGNENYNLPSPRLKETLRYFVQIGANAVIAHHTHCVSGYEVYNGFPIFYGIGNFIFDYFKNDDIEWSTGVAIELNFNDNNIDFKIFPFYQNYKNDIGINLFEEDDRITFFEKLDHLNKIISDDKKLNESFLDFIKVKQKQYSHFLEPYDSTVLHGLYGRNIIPSFLSRNKRKLYLNLIRCESHRDVLLKILNQ